MGASVDVIPVARLALGFVPALAVVTVLFLWKSEGGRTAGYALTRMLAQLLLVGYLLVHVFDSGRASVVLGVIAVMMLAASWIALRTAGRRTAARFGQALVCVGLAGGSTLAWVAGGVLQIDPWYEPRTLIPLAGMIFGSAMNSVSLAIERFSAELERDVPILDARKIAFEASLIPITNSLFAVGLVSLPGMMTGQILSGVSPLIAARFQILVMCMLFGASGLASASFLFLRARDAQAATTE